ncbi:MAG: right-handed parallel beta-helix repeat-containing protein [Treponema sp.]|nr:right-handed parallel beta-helix repeat-containing protein [Treponema sp.]
MSKASHYRFGNPHPPSADLRLSWLGYVFFVAVFALFPSCDNLLLGKNTRPHSSSPTTIVEQIDSFVLTYSKAYYVSPSGNDTNSGTISSPFKTIQKAVDKVQPGEAVIIREGTYAERVKIQKSGTPDKPIVIRSFPGEQATLNAQNVSGLGEKDAHGNVNWNNGVIQLTACKNIVIHGLAILNSKSSGIYCGGKHSENTWQEICSNVFVDSCIVKNCLGPGVCFGADYSPAEKIFVTRNKIENCAQISREAISLRSVDGFEISYNIVSRVKKESIDAKAGSQNGSIHHNTISEVGYESEHPSCGIYLDAWSPKITGSENQNYSTGDGVERNISVYCNIVKNLVHPKGNATAIAVASEQGNSCENIFIYNNLIYNTGAKCGAGIKIANNGDTTSGIIQNVFVYNNTVYATDQQGFYINYPNVKNIVIANNIAVGTNATSFGLLDESVLQNVHAKNNLLGNKPRYKNGNEITFPKNVCTVLTGEQVASLFENVDDEKFTPAKNSLAVDTAHQDLIDGRKCVPDTDFLGVVRPQGKASDIGAYER